MHVRDPQKREVVSRRGWDLSAPLISDAAQDSNRHSKSKTKRTVTNILALDLIMSICSPKPLAIGGTGNFTPTCIVQGHELCHRSGENPSDDDVDKLSNECCEPSTRLTLTCPTGNTNFKMSKFDCEQRSGEVDHRVQSAEARSILQPTVASPGQLFHK
ncbi:hypothetical protein C0Q70_17965 [Pomacea canaliculata]|uniref:Uncharacterized protein n=1 Tax=Pomacea canaliculata TaxID=400727 RepID=A0A2T7NLW7_POMCA|nr:hypothetical protein C0Q70_17965 [Pomacea canaliculata]